MITTVDGKIIIFIIGISVKIVKFSVFKNSLVNTIAMHIKGSIIFKFLWVVYCIKTFIIFILIVIKDTGIPTHI